MALFDIGEAALAQHAVHDARHRVQVVNDQHRIDIVDQDHPLQAAPPVIASSSPPRAPTRAARRPGTCNLHDSFGDQVAGRTGWQFNLFCAAFGGWH
jgi:hypothetical protein